MVSNLNRLDEYILLDEKNSIVATFRSKSNALAEQHRLEKNYCKAKLVKWNDCSEKIKKELEQRKWELTSEEKFTTLKPIEDTPVTRQFFQMAMAQGVGLWSLARIVCENSRRSLLLGKASGEGNENRRNGKIN